MDKRLTVGDLRKALEGVPDELEVHISSDYEIILSIARRVTYGDVDYFDIYGNVAEDEDTDW